MNPTSEHYAMDEADACTIASQWAAERGLRWTEPSAAERGREGDRRVWYVRSNAIGKGHSVGVRIDDETKRVIGHDELPR